MAIFKNFRWGKSDVKSCFFLINRVFGQTLSITGTVASQHIKTPYNPRYFYFVKLPYMTTITFDTFKFVDRLEKAGLSREQASAIVEAQKDAFSEALDLTLATKADIARLEESTKLSMSVLDAKMEKISWMVGILIAIAIANFAKQYF